jgi:hypothetical protein
MKIKFHNMLSYISDNIIINWNRKNRKKKNKVDFMK